MTPEERCNVPPYSSPYSSPFLSFFDVLHEWFPALIGPVFAATVFIFLDEKPARSWLCSLISWHRDAYVWTRTCSVVFSAGSLFLPQMSKAAGIDTELRGALQSPSCIALGTTEESCLPLLKANHLFHAVAYPRTLQALTYHYYSCIIFMRMVGTCPIVLFSFLFFHVPFSFVSYSLLSFFYSLTHLGSIFSFFRLDLVLPYSAAFVSRHLYALLVH